jgi:hypothetical protein
MNQYRCETCKKKCRVNFERIPYETIEKVGCASHSDFQNCQTGYIITEEQLQRLVMDKDSVTFAIENVVYEVRSHPYQSEQDTCPQNHIWQHCPAAERIRKQGRDKVLDKLIAYCKDRESTNKYLHITYHHETYFARETEAEVIRQHLEKLRQQAGEP